MLGLSRFLGDRWLQAWKGDIDARLQKLDAALLHRNFLLQRWAEFELEGLTECWRAARACLPLMNGTRPHGCGTDDVRLRTAASQLSDAHNALIGALGKHELFLPATVVDNLASIGRLVRLELSNIDHHEPFTNHWWEDGEKNSTECKGLCEVLLVHVRARASELRTEASSEVEKL